MYGYNLKLGLGGNRLPGGALEIWRMPSLVGGIGESSITIVSGDSSDLLAAQLSFDSSAVTLQADTDEGGDVLFDSADSMAPIVRYGYEWYTLLNRAFIFFGPKGIAIYSAIQTANITRIRRALRRYTYAQLLLAYSYANSVNLAVNPSDFNQTSWTKDGTPTITQFEGYQRFTTSSAVTLFLSDRQIPNTSDKNLTLKIQLRPLVDDKSIDLRIFNDNGSALTNLVIIGDYLPSDRFTTLYAKTSSKITDLASIWIKNIATEIASFDIKPVELLESRPLAIYSDGDSITQHALGWGTGAHGAVFNSYTHLLANMLNVTAKNAGVGGQHLYEISPRVVTAMDGAIYPYVILSGGTNDIFIAATDPSGDMIGYTNTMVAAAKQSADYIFLFNVRNSTAFTATENTWVNNYNALLLAQYSNDPAVILIDLNTVLNSATDLASDDIHPNLTGHVTLFNYLYSRIMSL